jgi:GTP-binding nuclear protein Ran
MARTINRTTKVVIIGDAGSGKTTFLHRYMTGEFTHDYRPTLDSIMHQLPIYTNKGVVTLDVWDIPGQNVISGLRTSWVNADTFIVFFDITSNLSYKSAVNWIYKLRAIVDVPIVLVANKVDIRDRKVRRDVISVPTNGTYYEISSKSNDNFDRPFLYIIRDKLGQDTHLIDGPVLVPPEVPR